MADPADAKEEEHQGGDDSPHEDAAADPSLKSRLLVALDEVTSVGNLGKWIAQRYNHDEDSQARLCKVMLDFFAVPQVAERIASKGPPAPQMLINVPGSTRKNVYIHPFHLDLSDTAKYGIGGKWPSNVQIKAHFPSIVSRGYESEREALEIKFPPDLHMSGKPLPPFRVQFIDGHCKATMIVGVFALLDYMGIQPDDIVADADMIHLIASLKYIRVNYVHFDLPEQCMYEALSLANRTSEKQKPGPLEMTLLFKEAVRVKRLTSKRAAVRDLLFGAIADYNRTVTNKAFRIKDDLKKVIYAVLRCPSEMLELMKECGDSYKWEHGAWTMEALCDDFYVPGHCLCSPQQTDPWWRQTKTVTPEATMLWARRVYWDFSKKAPANAAVKQKKLAQRDLPALRDLMEVCCLWNSILEPIRLHVGDAAALGKLDLMFKDGTLDAELRAHSKASEPGFDWQKLSFILELQGAIQEEEVKKAQNKISSALQSSLQAGFSLFLQNLENDQLLHRRYLLTSSGDEAKARAAVVASLEKMHNIAWKLVNQTITEICPTWCAAVQNKKLSTASPDASTDTSGIMEAKMQPWLRECLQGLNGGVRRQENEAILGWFNLTTQGVLSVDRLHFCLQQLTTLAAAYPKTFMAVVVLPNRAGDIRGTQCKSEVKAEDTDEESPAADQGEGEAGTEGEEDDENKDSSAESILRDFNYKLRCMFMERARNLRVKSAMVCFEPSSVYGQRQAFQEVILISAPDSRNCFVKAGAYRQGVIAGVSMLSRGDMVKPAKSAYGTDTRFTKVQEMKQYCGGMNFIAKVAEALAPSPDIPLVLLDMFGFDGWCGSYAISQAARGRKVACATICHTKPDSTFVSNVLSTKLFSMARANEFSIGAFPDFSAALKELKQFQRSPQPEYQVCVATAEGSLVIRQTLLDFWMAKEGDFPDKVKELLKAHNTEFNEKNLKRGGAESAETATSEEPPAKRLRLGTATTLQELEGKHPERTVLNGGLFTLHLCDDDRSLWLAGGSSDHTVEANTELFGFGSGEFSKGSEAADLMSDTSESGRWLIFKLVNSSCMIILEKQRQTPEHLDGGAFFNKVMCLNELLKMLEDAGEVNIQLAEHKLTKDSSGNFSVESLGDVAFVLDTPKPKKKKAKAGNALTYGAKMDLSKLRVSNNITILWRMRLQIDTGNGPTTQVVPVRPCAVMAGSASLKPGEILQLL